MLAITHSFVAHTDAKAEEVTQDFQDVQTWANAHNHDGITSVSAKRFTIWYKNHTASTVEDSNQAIYRGWGFIAGDGTSATTIVVVLPNSGFDNYAYFVTAHVIGTKANSDPSNEANCDSATPHNLTVLNSTTPQSATQFQLRIADTDGAAITAARRVLFTWLAIGPKA